MDKVQNLVIPNQNYCLAWRYTTSLFSMASRPTLGPTHLPIQSVLEAISPGLKRLGREADNSPPSSAEVKNGGIIPPLPHVSSWNSA
jgi:hypothetical protein